MNFSKEVIVVILFLALTGTFANAQNNTFSNTITIGIGTPMLDSSNVVGFHIGYNPSFSLSEYFAIEGQVSYFNTQVVGAFLSGDMGTVHSVNALAGPRLYFTFEDKDKHFYLNFLVGGLYHNEMMDRIDSAPEFAFGLSCGAFMNVNQFTFGLSYDTPGNVILKAGRTF